MELCKASRYVLAGLQKFEAQSLDEEQQPAAEVIKYVLDRYPSERRGDRFYASMKVVLKAFNQYPPKIGSVKQQCSYIVDLLDDDATEFRAFNERFR
jgi:hypothetical protein